MSHRIGIVAEADADGRTISILVDHVICESNPPDWIDVGNIDDYRTYCGLDDSAMLLRWQDVDKPHRGLVLPIRADRKTLKSPDAFSAYRVLINFARLPSNRRVDAVILVRDADHQPERRSGLEQARNTLLASPHNQNGGFRVVIAFANTKRECWHICGFEPAEHEQQLLEELRSGTDGLGFDPRIESHQLTASNDHANDKRSVKRVLDHLTGGNCIREFACLDSSLSLLHERGTQNGLNDFLNEIESIILPMFGGLPDRI